MKMLVVSIYGNPSYRYYEYTVQAVLVKEHSNGIDEQEELEEVGAHTEDQAREFANELVQGYMHLADDTWERF